MIGIWHDEIPVLDPPTEPIIGMNNQPELAISTVVVQDQQSLNTPTMEEIGTTRERNGLTRESEGLAFMVLTQLPV